MAFLRVASLAVLAVWVGGLAALGLVAAPTIFATLEAQDPVAGRALAGLVFGAIFERFQHWAWGLGLLALVILAARALLGPRPRRLALRMWVIAGMLGLSLTSALLITPRIDQIRSETVGPVASLPDSDARKVTFGRLHGLSNVLMLVTLVAGLGLFWAETKDSQ